MNLTLQEFLKVKSCRFEFHGKTPALKNKVAGIAIDSRTVGPGEVFFALRGERHDGHEFVAEVCKKQVAAVVVSKKWWRENGASFSDQNIFAVEDTLKALQEAAHYYRKKFDLPVLGLTGTNGKTTTKEMIAAALSNLGDVCKTPGNLNNHIGVPLTLFSLSERHRILILEMGTNHFGEIARLCEIGDPNYGLITNIGRGHLEFFTDLVGVVHAKMELFDYLRPNGTAFVNLDDPLIRKHTPALRKHVTYGLSDRAQVQGHFDGLDSMGRPTLRVQNVVIKVPVPGQHNIYNALAAVAVGLEFGVDLADIKAALEQVKLPAKRMEIFERNGITVLNDAYNANPDSTVAALEVLRQMPAAGKRIFVFGDMLELGEAARSEHEKIGATLRDYAVDVFLAFGDHTAAAVEAAQKATDTLVAQHFDSKEALSQSLKQLANPGDVVLVKGSRGMKMEEVLEELF